MIRIICVIRVPLMRSLLRTPIAEPYTQLITDLVVQRLRAVFPMPGFVEVRIETEALGVHHQPLIDLRVDLYRAIPVVSADRFAADVKVQRATGEMRAVDCQAGAPRSGILSAKHRLIGPRAKRRDDLQPGAG